MSDNDKRGMAVISVAWDPHTGQLRVDASGANGMEQLGILVNGLLALHASLTPKNDGRRVIPAGIVPMFPAKG